MCSPIDLNLTDELDAGNFLQQHGYSWTDTLVHTVFLPLILIIGLLGNVAFLVVVWRIEWMRTVTNCYLVNLALSDVAFLSASVGEKVHQYLQSPFVYDDYPKGPLGCALVPVVKDLCFFASLLFVTCISAERFSAACHPLRQRRDKGPRLRRRAARLTALAWTVSLAMAALRMSASCCQYRVYCLAWPESPAHRGRPRFIGECRPAAVWVAYATRGIQLVLFALAMAVNAALYGKITRAVHCSTARPHARQTPSSASAIEAKITRMVVATGVVFFLCLAPYELFSALLMVLPGYDGSMVSAMQVCRMLMHMNSAINPFIYNVANPRYRRAFSLTFVPKGLRATRLPRRDTREVSIANTRRNRSPSPAVLSTRKNHMQLTEQTNGVHDKQVTVTQTK